MSPSCSAVLRLRHLLRGLLCQPGVNTQHAAQLYPVHPLPQQHPVLLASAQQTSALHTSPTLDPPTVGTSAASSPTAHSGAVATDTPHASSESATVNTAYAAASHATPQAQPTPGSSFVKSQSVNAKEAAKFAALAHEWWRPDGPFGPLLKLNPTRCQFIRESVCGAKGLPLYDAQPFQGLKFIDVGCGGGILSESIARLGADVHGVDVSEENVRVAAEHAQMDPVVASRARYECVSAESLAEAGAQYDVVLASEVIEHVKRPDLFCKTLARLVKPDGVLVISTLNRTLVSYALAIVGAEYVLRMVPRGTHYWNKFITPQELAIMMDQAKCTMHRLAGMSYNPLSGSWSLSDDVHVNYICSFQPSAVPHP